MFRDRKEAGRLLAQRLGKYDGKNTIVLAIPRGGIVVADEVAKSIGAELGLIISRKIGAPYEPEYAIGAVAPDRSFVLDKKAVREMRVQKDYIDRMVRIESIEIDRRMRKYGVEIPDVKGKVVIVVDDGMATGYTIRVAVDFLRKMEPKSIVVAVPVAPADSIKDIGKTADDVVCLEEPAEFHAIGAHYRKFPQVSDEEVINIIAGHRRRG